MKANKFVKEHGWGRAKELLTKANGCASIKSIGYHFLYSDLERLVESYEVVESLGGLDEAKKRLQQANEGFSILISFKNKSGAICSVYDHVLTKAIADVESCQ